MYFIEYKKQLVIFANILDMNRLLGLFLFLGTFKV